MTPPGTTDSVEKVHVTRTPGLCGGRPCVANTRIRVQDIYVWHELQGRSPDDIVTSFPQLTLADVYAALAHFWAHRDEILAQMKVDDALIEAVKARFPSKLPPIDRPGDSRDMLPPR